MAGALLSHIVLSLVDNLTNDPARLESALCKLMDCEREGLRPDSIRWTDEEYRFYLGHACVAHGYWRDGSNPDAPAERGGS